MTPPARSEKETVLIVDDVPENLAFLHDALDAGGYSVCVAVDGIRALESARRKPPDVILLDAVMPGLDGFETCRHLKSDLATRHIPVIFMTGLSDTDHVVQGFRAGGVDYVTKPVSAPEVLARIDSHLRNARLLAEAQRSSDAAGDATVAVDAMGRVQWATPLAQRWLKDLLDAEGKMPASLRVWLSGQGIRRDPAFSLVHAGRRLEFRRLGAAAGGGARLLIRRHTHVPEPDALMRALPLTARQAEVLHWLAFGKTNSEIALVLDMSPRTVNKHLEHIFAKLNVETRTAATTVALNKGRSEAVESES
jgi:DNA-binding NarL/FixJ family response regulator